MPGGLSTGDLPQRGTLHERIFLLEGRDDPVVVYVMELGSPERARSLPSVGPTDRPWAPREIMEEVLAAALPVEELLNPRMPGGIEVRETSAQPVGGLPTTKLKQQRH